MTNQREKKQEEVQIMTNQQALYRTMVRYATMLGLALALLVGVSGAALAAGHGRQARVDVYFADLDIAFGAIGNWEASLYAGAIEGQETSGRFTEWVAVEDGRVTLVVPGDVREGSSVPWNERDNTYVRLRTSDGYPQFDIVSEPFTLRGGPYALQFAFEQTVQTQSSQQTEVRIVLNWGDPAFGNVAAWEGSLYAGAEAGQETSGRFTEWIASPNGAVIILIPEDLRPEAEIPDDDIYIRIRSTEGYPTFDMVGAPFPLGENEITTVTLSLSRSVRSGPLPVVPPVEKPPVGRGRGLGRN